MVIGPGVVVESFSRLEGPCYVGQNTWLLSATVRSGTSIGPECRIGGEVAGCILQGHAYTGQGGYLGHSHIGEWVRFAREQSRPMNGSIIGRFRS